MTLLLSDALEEFYTVAERIAKLEAVVAGNRDSIQNLNPFLLQPRSPAREVSHLISDMRFRRLTVDSILHADMHLLPSDL